MTRTTQHSCPLAYCDPQGCGWRSGDDTCDWVEEALVQGTITEDE